MGKLTTCVLSSLAALLLLAPNPMLAAGAAAETKNESGKAVVVESGDEHNEYCSITDPDQKAPIKFACINHLADTAEAEEVIKTMANYSKAYVSQDYKTCAEYMTDGITTFDQRSKRLIVGKDAVLTDMKARLDKSLPDSDSPLLSYTLDHPLAPRQRRQGLCQLHQHQNLWWQKSSHNGVALHVHLFKRRREVEEIALHYRLEASRA